MAKKMCVAMLLRKTIEAEGIPYEIGMPKGIVGMLTVYESKKAAREILGNKADLREITFIKEEPPHERR